MFKWTIHLLIVLAVLAPSVYLQSEIPSRTRLLTRLAGTAAKTALRAVNSVTSFATGFASDIFGDEGEVKSPPFWGPKFREKLPEDRTIHSITINIDETILKDLKARLTLETSKDGDRLTQPLESIGFEYGMNSNFLKNVTDYWLNKYDWRKREKRLNKYPHFTTMIYGIDIHFQRASPSVNSTKPVRPLLLLHGWPSTFADFQKVIPLLTEPAYSAIKFELIIPSLPGFGFSEMAYKPGLSTPQISQLLLKLMKRLGYSKFYVHGENWGAVIAGDMAAMYPKYVIGIHMSMCSTFNYRSFLKLGAGQVYRGRGFEDKKEAERLYPLNKYFTTIIQELGYFHLQATKPDTIGAGLAHSPTGLASYIIEKFSIFRNLKWKNQKDGGIMSHFNLDELLDTVMIYWVTNTITSSVRLYYEYFANNPLALVTETLPVEVPTACLNMPDDFWSSQNEWLVQDKFPKIVHYTKAKKGGHFTALENPDILAQDLIEFYNKIDTNFTLV